MNTIFIQKEALARAMEKAMETYAVAAPMPASPTSIDSTGAKDGYLFRCLDTGEVPNLAYTATKLSPKALLFPQAETMFRFKVPSGGENGSPFLEAESFKERPLAVVGIRPWDAKAFDMLKLNFDSKDYKDPFFLKRYHQMVRVGLADAAPSDTNFSLACGTGPFDTSALDILLAETRDGYIGKVITAKGKAFATAAGFETGTAEDAKTLNRMKKEAENRMKPGPDFAALASADTLDLHREDHWEHLAFSCINCGSCTFSCPTCWCFDIQDEVAGDEGVRLRLWDTCMSDLYSAHASGHNPRQEGFRRFRNRFMHKLKYFPDKYGQGIMCVGCGRCIDNCPAGIDIRNVIGTMNASAAAATSAAAAAAATSKEAVS